MSIWPFRRSQTAEDALRLLDAVTLTSRNFAFFGEGRVPDTLEGRFALMTIHGALALIRLKQDPQSAGLAQAFTDVLFRQFDAGLREAGVGDTSVPKRMHKMAGEFYGRLDAYEQALGDDEALAAALVRNVVGLAPGPFVEQLSGHVRRLAAQQAAAPALAMLEPDSWAPATS